MITPFREMWFDFFRDRADITAGWEGERRAAARLALLGVSVALSRRTGA
jgi:hypothetical protein